MRAAVLGVSGYGGMGLMRLLLRHPSITTVIPVSSSQAGEPVRTIDPGLDESGAARLQATDGRAVDAEAAAKHKPDVVFSSLPHLASARALEPFYEGSVVIDLSADFRLDDAATFEQVYGEAPARPDLLTEAVYGLSEWNAAAIAEADLIANPGCYPTCTLLPLLPLLSEELIRGPLIVNALSGISGAGRAAKRNMLFCERSENMQAYSPGMTHRHVAEIVRGMELFSSRQEIFFTPHLVPIKQGMFVTTVVEPASGVDGEAVRRSLERAYSDKPCVRFPGPRIPETRHVRNSNVCALGYHIEDGRLALFSVLDNLYKGAAGQAVQNMNLRFGLGESTGLPLDGEF